MTGSTLQMDGLSQRLKALVADTREQTGVPGIAVGVSVAGERVFAIAGSSAIDSGIALTTATRFQIGCVTKMLTSLAVMNLVCSNRLSLDAPVSEYLPALRETPGAPQITVHHLGSHTAGYRGLNPGIPQFGYFYTWDKFLNFLKALEQVFTPGTTFNYEHTESVLLGEVFRRVSGEPVEDFVRREIFRPLDLEIAAMAASGAGTEALAADHAIDAATGAYKKVKAVPFCPFWMSSLSNWVAGIEDLLTMAEAFVGREARWAVDPQAVQRVRDPLVAVPPVTGGPKREEVPVSFGFGCAEYAGHLFGHNGSGRGQTCAIRFDPGRRLCIAVGLNSWQPYIRELLIHEIAELVDPVPKRPRRVVELDASAHDFAGTYQGCTTGTRVVVNRSGHEWNCDICDSSGEARVRLTLAANEAGQLSLKTNSQHLCVGFFRDKVDGTPGLMLGLNAFRKLQ